MVVYALYPRFKIIVVEFAARKMVAVVVASNGDAHASQMSVEYLIALFSVVVQKPFVKGYGLLGGVDAV